MHHNRDQENGELKYNYVSILLLKAAHLLYQYSFTEF